jgi:uncharacterized OB-fold protein
VTETYDAVPKPAMLSSPQTERWWEAAAQGRLLLQRCGNCAHVQHYPRPMCVVCWSESITWIESAGLGSIWTFTVAHVPAHPAWLPEVPYVVALVELDEGPRMLTNILGADHASVRVGDRVRLADREARTDRRLIQFVLAEQ